jgi:hypothetical protein
MSTATHHSSLASASSRRAPPGVESTGLPAKISMPRTWPSPGVVISSARPATGNSPLISGSPLTRCVWRPWSPKPSSRALEHRADVERRVGEHRAAGDVEARRPRTRVPAARDAARAVRGGPHTARPPRGPRRGDRHDEALAADWPVARAVPIAGVDEATVQRLAQESPPGAIATCSEACVAVSVRRGSTTTTLPPRATIARSRWRARGAVMSEPFDTDGFAPSTSM